MKIVLLSFLLFFSFNNSFAQQTPFEKGNKNTTATYDEIISFYTTLDKASNLVTMEAVGESDAGLPLHIVYVSSVANVKFAAANRPKHKTLIFINNGIHPGEPDGIDATMLLVRDIVQKKITLPNNVLLAIIPVYNIGGCLNRSANYRVDQNGPEEFGFRGNSQNLDLNRDFIKNDTKEAKTFASIYTKLLPQLFIDNHVSNGADYQHVMTLLSSQHNKLGGAMGTYLHNTIEPKIYASMKTKGYDLVPYVNFFGETPEQGWTEFYDSPRYSSGYATLWHSFAFVPETHMLKPYWQRVDATYKLMESFITFASDNSSIINKLQQEAIDSYNVTLSSKSIDWVLDKAQHTSIPFKGYESGKKISSISGLPRLYYDRLKPFEKLIPFYNTYQPSVTTKLPKAYIIPQGWWKVIALLKHNNIKTIALPADTIINVESYTIDSYKSNALPYEAHHSNSAVKLITTIKRVAFRKGDVIVPMNQIGNRFLLETLEPNARDSYFTWNFFDGILGQKEGYSNYVFEETAEQLLKEDASLKAKFEAEKSTNEKFAKDGEAQLDFIYKNSKYVEPAFMQYPVYRIVN